MLETASNNRDLTEGTHLSGKPTWLRSSLWREKRNAIASLRVALLAILASLSLVALSDGSVVVEVQVTPDANNDNNIWVGVYSEPLVTPAKAWSWSLLESKPFSLELPNVELATVVALRKGSVPIVQTIEIGKSIPTLNLHFQEGISTEGIIYSSDGIPVPNATLTVDYEHLRSLNIPDAMRSVWASDSNGRYKIGGLVVGTHALQVSPRRGLLMESFSIDAKSGQNNSHDLHLANAYFVTGRVVDHEDALAHGVEIRASAATGSNPDLLVESDENGEFRLGPYAEGQMVDVVARRSDGASALYDEVVAGRHGILLRLSHRVWVSAVVVDGVTNEPLNAFSLWEFGGRFPLMHDFLDAGGQLSASVDPNSKGLAIDSIEHTAHYIHPVLLSGATEHDFGVIQLQPGRQLSGSIFDAETGQPISGASVAVSLQESRRMDWSSKEALRHLHMANRINATTDTDGMFNLQPLPSHSIALAVGASTYEAARVQVGESTLNIEIAMNPKASNATRLRGTLAAPSGKPVNGTVFMWNTGTSSGSYLECENGSFDVAGEPGTYRISGFYNLSESNVEEIVLREGEAKEVHLVLEHKGRLTASIRGLRSAETLLLKIVDFSVLSHREVRVSENGEHSFEGLGSGTFVLTATTTMRRQLKKTFSLHGDDGEALVQLSFEGSSRLHGSVNCEPQTTSEFHVVVTPQDPSSLSSRCTTIDRAFDLRGLDDGSYRVAVFPSTPDMLQHAPLAQAEVDVAGDTELHIDVTGVALSGTVYPTNESAGTRVSLRHASDGSVVGFVVIDHSGHFRFETFRPGTYLLTASHDRFLPYGETMEISSTLADHRIQLRNRPTGTLELAGIVKPIVLATGAHVTLRRTSDSSIAGRVRVDRNGRFLFSELQQEEYGLSVFREGFEPFRATLALDESLLDFQVTLNPAGSLVLAGIVRPVGDSEGARVALERTSDGEFVGSAMTDAKGQFELVGLQPDDYVVHVYHEDFEVEKQSLFLDDSIHSKEISLQALKQQEL